MSDQKCQGPNCPSNGFDNNHSAECVAEHETIVSKAGNSETAEDGRRMQQLQVSVDNGVLSISIGVDVLAHAVTMGAGGMGELTVTDADVFAGELVHALKSEEEDGTTPVHRMLDKVSKHAAEQGAEGIDFDDA